MQRRASWLLVLSILSPVVALAAAPECNPAPSLKWDFPDVCDVGQRPDEACYVTKRDPASDEVELALEIADRYMTEHPPTELTWDWGPGTLMFALTELYRVTGESRLRDYYQAWMDHYIEVGYPLTWSDHCPPALTALALYQETGQEPYRAVVQDVIHYLETEALRTEEGGISHMGVQDVFSPTLWLDSLFMFGTTLTRWAEVTGEVQTLDELGRQFRIFRDALQDDSGLFFHAYDWPAAPNPDVFWARGNGWVTASGYDYLRARRLRGERDRAVQDLLARQLDAVIETQDSTGLWWTVMDHPGEIYLETSAAALFGYGMARGYRYGVLDADVLGPIALALSGVRSRITRDASDRPVVTGISGPTTAGSYNSYASVGLQDDLHYGVGAVLLFLLEASGLDLPAPSPGTPPRRSAVKW